MDKGLFLGIPGVDIPYPKYVQDALDFIDKETRVAAQWERELARQKRQDERYERQVRYWEAERTNDEKFRITRRKQKDAQQKKRPYQQVDYADQWPSW